MGKAFVVLEAELPWVYPLALELGECGPTVAVSLGASGVPFRRKVSWPFEDPDGRVTNEVWTYPPGFNGTLAPLFNRSVRARLQRAILVLRSRSGESPYIVTPYPPFFPYVRDVEPSRVVYLNYDDYAVSAGPGRWSDMPHEAALVKHAGTVVCSASYQVTRFKEKFSGKRDAVFHLPHGVHESFLNPAPLRPPEPNTLCSVGNLTSRYDWKLIHEVATRLPEVTFCFVGNVDTPGNAKQREDWLRWLALVLGLPNVVHVPCLRHRDTAPYYWNSAANWMPYTTDLRFVKACSPLKIPDGLASGRPIISSAVPECQLYPDWISIYRDADEAVSLIRAAVAPGRCADQVRVREQIAFAQLNTWAIRARRLVEILERR